MSSSGVRGEVYERYREEGIAVTFDNWMGLTGIVITVLSVGFGVWQQRLRARLERFIRAQNWFLYEKANQARWHLRLCGKFAI
jgi:hypothetical protein